jgi:formylglycine-generating enzyme required for sulfatase activity
LNTGQVSEAANAIQQIGKVRFQNLSYQVIDNLESIQSSLAKLKAGAGNTKRFTLELKERYPAATDQSELMMELKAIAKEEKRKTRVFSCGFIIFIIFIMFGLVISWWDIKDGREAEQKAEEAKAKLHTEIGAGRVGATLGVSLGGKLVMPFAFCPAGSFTMGSPSTEEGRSDDENEVSVTLSKAFWMAKTEVTQAQWCAVMGSNPSQFKGDNLPVEYVSWFDAQEFIKKVNGSGEIPAGWKVCLPTEAQWECACRAGEKGPFSGGSIDEVAWYNENSQIKTPAVGTKKQNAWGLHDMHGSVWEWCADWYDGELSGSTNPLGPSSGVRRVLRGGSWNDFAAGCRAASRFNYSPDYRSIRLGFRPALVQSE